MLRIVSTIMGLICVLLVECIYLRWCIPLRWLMLLLVELFVVSIQILQFSPLTALATTDSHTYLFALDN